MTRFVLFIITCWFAAAQAAQAASDVTKTRHNLSLSGPGAVRSASAAAGTEVCVFCHTPHNPLPDTPLWNREEAAAVTYTPYDSSTMAARPGQPTGESRLCLSCHDGTVALGALRNQPGGAGSDMASVRLAPGHRGFLGTDLSDDHPISFDYDAGLYSDPELGIANPTTIDLPLENISGERHLQCTTCHDAHESDLRPFLRKAAIDGQLCTTCHVKSGLTWDWMTSSHATSTAATPPSIWPERKPEWVGATVAENSCLSCHDMHTAAMPQRLITKVEEDTCYACHDGTVASSNIEREINDPLKDSNHPVDVTPNPDHDATKAENPLTMPLHAECADCHNPHAVDDADPMITLNPSDLGAPRTIAPAANARIAGVTGLDINGNSVREITNQYELCFKCHGRPGRGPCGGLPDSRCTTATDHSMTRLDRSYNIRDKVNSSNPALVSWHPIESNNPANNSEVLSLNPPLNASTSLIYCTDCHNNDDSAASGGIGPNGPHASTYEFILAQRYTLSGETPYSTAVYELCFKCHNAARFGSPTPGEFDHEIHLNGGDITCINCHDPHGSEKSTHLINFLLTTTNGGNWTITACCGRTEPTFEDLGVQDGRCFLSCHGKDHDGTGDFTY